MCFDLQSGPPLEEPRTSGQNVALRTADGALVDAFVARAQEPRDLGVVLLPDVRGLHGYYMRLAECLAARGAHVVTFDYYARTAGRLPRRPDFDPFPHRDAAAIRTLEEDLRSAVDLLHLQIGRPERLYAFGFCFGGRLALYAATLDLPLSGAVSFYSPLKERHPVPHPREVAPRIRCPILGLFAGRDNEGALIARLEMALLTADVPHDFHVYADAPHSFFDDQLPEYRRESEDAWSRVCSFMGIPSEAPLPD